MFVSKKILSYGANHPTVARLQIQSLDFLNATTLSREEIAEIIEGLLEITARIISLDEARLELLRSGDNQFAELKERFDAGGRPEIPHLHTLPVVFEGFFYDSKNAIRDLGKLLKPLYGRSFGDARDWCLERNKRNSAVEKYLLSQASAKAGFKNLADEISKFRGDIEIVCGIRNALEHPGGFNGVVELHNFEAVDGGIRSPWFKFKEIEYDVNITLANTGSMLVSLVERVVVTACMFRFRDKLTAVRPIPPEKRNPECPMAFELLRLDVLPDIFTAKKQDFGVFQ